MTEPTPRRDRLGANPQLVWGVLLSGLLMAVGLAAPLLAPYDPAEQLDPAAASKRPPGTYLHAVALPNGTWMLADEVERRPGGLWIERLGETDVLPEERVLNLTADGVADHRLFLLGSDRFGRDLLSRMIYGTRVSLAISLLSVALALSLGVMVGAVAGANGALVDGLLMRLVDALLCFPYLFLLLAVSALFPSGDWLLILVLGGTAWMPLSRLVRAEIKSLKGRPFVAAARAVGQSPWRILVHHLLPNAWTPVLVQGPLLIGQVILVESALSFLGLGVRPPLPSWGNMIDEGNSVLTSAWWISAFPGAALGVTVIAFNLLGDGLRDELDPKRREASGRV